LNTAESFSTGKLILITSLLFSVGPLTVDLSLPGLAAIQSDIGVSNLRVELTLSLVFLGMALSQLLFGTVADRLGRRVPLIVAMCVYVVGSVVAMTARSMPLFAGARLLQALAYGVAVVLARSGVVDVCDERRSAKVFSTALMVMSLAGVLAPALGGQILTYANWRWLPAVMAVFGTVCVLAIAILLPETLPSARRSQNVDIKVLTLYGQVLSNTRFVGFALIGACAVASQFTYSTGAPAVLLEHFTMNPVVTGLWLSAIALSMALASQLNALLLRWRDPEWVMSRAVLAGLVCGIALTITTLTGYGATPGFLISLFGLGAAIGLTMPNAMAAAMTSVGPRAGAASALIGVMQFTLGSIGSAAVGAFHYSGGELMAVVILAFTAFGFLISARRRPGSVAPSAAHQS
jgi:DHA1 family bicyclomycin/chloramphenicol resistance-like MFS transporter